MTKTSPSLQYIISRPDCTAATCSLRLHLVHDSALGLSSAHSVPTNLPEWANLRRRPVIQSRCLGWSLAELSPWPHSFTRPHTVGSIHRSLLLPLWCLSLETGTAPAPLRLMSRRNDFSIFLCISLTHSSYSFMPSVTASPRGAASRRSDLLPVSVLRRDGGSPTDIYLHMDDGGSQTSKWAGLRNSVFVYTEEDGSLLTAIAMIFAAWPLMKKSSMQYAAAGW